MTPVLQSLTLLPFLELNKILRPFLFICTEGCLTEQHRERRQSHSHVGQDDFQSQQTRPKREEDGERYISFPTFFQINARPWRRQPDILPRDEEVWRSTDLCTLPAPCQAPFQTTAWPLGPRGLSIWTLSTTRLSALLGHPRGSLCFH